MSVEPILSEREQEILQLVATGASNKEIAQRLVISPNTVKVHLRNIFSKIGVVSRTEATLYALRENLIPQVGVNAGAAEGVVTEPIKLALWHQQLRFQIAAGFVALLILGVGIFFAAGGAQILRQPTPSAVGFVQPERWTVLANLPHALSGMAAIQYENTIYIIGGQEQDKISGELLRYNADSDTWSAMAAKPTSVYAVHAGVIGEKIYLPGGVGADGQPVNTLEVYNPRTDVWSQAASLPEPLSDYALAAFEGQLFLFGGWNGNEYIDRVYVYNPAEDRWAERKPMDKVLGGAVAVVSGSKIYLIGGIDGNQTSSAMRVYFPNREISGESAWESRSNMPATPIGSGAVAMVNSIYALGDSSDAATGSFKIFRFDEASNIWTELENAPVVIGNQAELVALNTKIHILGGNIDGTVQPAHLAYQAVYTVLIPAISR